MMQLMTDGVSAEMVDTCLPYLCTVDVRHNSSSLNKQ